MDEKEQLSSMFPALDHEVILFTLDQFDGDSEKALEALLAMQEENEPQPPPPQQQPEPQQPPQPHPDGSLQASLIKFDIDQMDENGEVDSDMAAALAIAAAADAAEEEEARVRSAAGAQDDHAAALAIAAAAEEAEEEEARAAGGFGDDGDAALAATLAKEDMESNENESYMLALKLQNEQHQPQLPMANGYGGGYGGGYGRGGGGYGHGGGGYGGRGIGIGGGGGDDPLAQLFGSKELENLQEMLPDLLNQLDNAEEGGLQKIADSLIEPLTKNFLPQLQEQFMELKFPAMEETLDAGADTLDVTMSEISFKKLVVPENKIKFHVNEENMDCELTITGVAAKINPIKWTYSKLNKFPRVKDDGVLKGQVSDCSLNITFNLKQLINGGGGKGDLESKVNIGSLKLRVAKTTKSFIYNTILRNVEKHLKEEMEKALEGMINEL